jgi:hypothetical protein
MKIFLIKLTITQNHAAVTFSMETIYLPLVFPYKTKRALSYLSL